MCRCSEKKKSAEEKGKLARELAEKCLQILREKYGVKNAFIFGSLRGDSHFDERSDIDIAVEGLAPERYFEALTELYALLPAGFEVDLVPLERAQTSLVALAKGGVQMPEEPIEALKVEVGYEGELAKNCRQSEKGNFTVAPTAKGRAPHRTGQVCP